MKVNRALRPTAAELSRYTRFKGTEGLKFNLSVPLNPPIKFIRASVDIGRPVEKNAS